MERIVEEYGSHNAEELLSPHTLARSFCFYPETLPLAADRSYDTNSAFWNDVFKEKVIAERVVVLQGFNVFEWIPRNPGLYHTQQASYSREAAQYLVRDDPALGYGDRGAESPDHAAFFRKATQAEGSARRLIYTPQGKTSMLEGGVGCVRLSPIELKQGGQFWFMAASSSNAPDEGIPLLMADDFYQTLIDEIRSVGSTRRIVVGKTKFVSAEFRDLYSQYRGIPRLYLEVVDVREHAKKPEATEVSVAASFLSEYEGYPKIYASYVTFNPGYEGARQSAAQWMKQEYIEGLYKGSVLTDFDQQAPTIAGTLFSLDQVMTSVDLAEQISILKRKYGYVNWDLLDRSNLSFSIHKEKVMINVTGDGNVVNTGYMKNVVSTVTKNIAQSAASEEIKSLMNVLVTRINEIESKVDSASVQKMGKNMEALSAEIKSPNPDRKWYEVSLGGLKEAAEAVGELGVPILKTVAKLMPLLIPQ